MARGNQAQHVVVAMAREVGGCLWALAHAGPVTPSGQQTAHASTRNAAGCSWASAETPPRCGVTLDGVKRPLGPPRAAREAGTRRTPVRWSSTHGYPQDHPS